MERPTKVDVLGTVYRIEYRELASEGYGDGWCDSTDRLIVIRDNNVNKLGDFERLQRKALRHEIIHAFLEESGLSCNYQHFQEFGHEETMVDWIAIQFPKILKAFRDTGCI